MLIYTFIYFVVENRKEVINTILSVRNDGVSVDLREISIKFYIREERVVSNLFCSGLDFSLDECAKLQIMITNLPTGDFFFNFVHQNVIDHS